MRESYSSHVAERFSITTDVYTLLTHKNVINPETRVGNCCNVLLHGVARCMRRFVWLHKSQIPLR